MGFKGKLQNLVMDFGTFLFHTAYYQLWPQYNGYRRMDSGSLKEAVKIPSALMFSYVRIKHGFGTSVALHFAVNLSAYFLGTVVWKYCWWQIDVKIILTISRNYRVHDWNKMENQSAQCRKVLPSLLLFKKQQIFHLPSPLDARNYLAFIAAEGNVLLVNVPVPGFQFLYQLAFGKVFAA